MCIQYLISKSTVDLHNELSKFYTDASYLIFNHYELVDCSTYTEYQHSPTMARNYRSSRIEKLQIYVKSTNILPHEKCKYICSYIQQVSFYISYVQYYYQYFLYLFITTYIPLCQQSQLSRISTVQNG